MRCLFSICLAFFSMLAIAAERPVLIWVGSDVPPISILHGTQAGQGFVDWILRDAIRQLPDFKHEFVETNYERGMLELESRKNVCSAFMLNLSEQRANVRLSEPYLVTLPYGVITVTNAAEQGLARFKDGKGVLDLENLVRQGNFRVGVPFGRSMGARYSRIIESMNGAPGLFMRQGAVGARGLLEMLFSGRIDAMVGFQTEVNYVMRQMGRDPSLLGFHPVSGGDPATFLYFGCSRSPLGERVISRLNPYLVANRDRYAKIYEAWLNEGTRRRYLREIRPLLR